MKKKYVAMGLLVVVIFLVFFVYENTRFKTSEPSPSKLLDDFTSYQSKEEYLQILKKNGHSFVIQTDSKLTEKDKRPQFTIETIKTESYKNMGLLEGLFLNNRLLMVTFYPEQYDLYLDTISKQIGEPIKKGDRKRINSHSILSTDSDSEKSNQMYIRWTDEKLMEEYLSWIKQYS